MRKFLSMLLALTMILAMLAACNNNVDDPIDDPNQEVQGDEVVDDGKLTLVEEGKTDYVIVRGENCSPSEIFEADHGRGNSHCNRCGKGTEKRDHRR